MFNKEQMVYYINSNYTIDTAIYKGEVHICPYISVLNLYKEDEGNFLINPDFVFNNKDDAKIFIDYL